MIYTDTLPELTSKVANKLSGLDFLKDFYLSGGTALSLQLGHRESEDLDFFNQTDFKPKKILQELQKVNSLKEVQIDSGTLNCFLDGVQLQFLYYPYSLLKEKKEWNGIYLSSVLDIACTKLITISERGSKKDFVDLFFLLQEFELNFLFNKLGEKYKEVDYNKIHILKSLIYFYEAETQPMPRMHKKVNWEEVKEKISQEVKKMQIDMLPG